MPGFSFLRYLGEIYGLLSTQPVAPADSDGGNLRVIAQYQKIASTFGGLERGQRSPSRPYHPEYLPRDTTSDIARLACYEERIPPELLALLGQSLEIEHLANRHAPTAQQDLVERPIFL